MLSVHLFNVTFSMLHVRILRNCSTAPSVPKVDNPIHWKKNLPVGEAILFPSIEMKRPKTIFFVLLVFLLEIDIQRFTGISFNSTD